MPDVPQAPLALTAMTLRGVGSYLHGARLDIRPLTILCGANGSGKSTWFKAFELLRNWHSSGHFPFPRFDGNHYGQFSDHSTLMHDYLNALVKESEPTEFEVEDEEFGSVGTIGLSFMAMMDFSLDISANEDEPSRKSAGSSFARDLLWHGTIRRGTNFRLQIAHPSEFNFLAADGIARRQSQVEMRCNDFSIHLQGDSRGEDFTFACSSGFLADSDDESCQVVPIAVIHRERRHTDEIVVEPLAEYFGKAIAERICRQGIKLIRKLFSELEKGWFHVGAVRRLHEYGDVEWAPDGGNEMVSDNLRVSELVVQRRVGPSGDAALVLERKLRSRRMCEVDDRDDRPVPNEFEPNQVLGGRTPEYILETFVSYWLRRLLDTEIKSPFVTVDGGGLSLADAWNDGRKLGPSGFLLADATHSDLYGPIPSEWIAPRQWFDPDENETDVFLTPCGGGKQSLRPFRPKRLSAGFHQVFPLIVQLSVMRQCELLALENPEAHLHPSLQLKLTEFLIHQAMSGRQLMIETHSDLVVRRVLRAILGEEIAQSQVAIYFANIDKEEHGYHYSTLTPLSINEQGQIANWPEGFMDDDVKESQRLLDIMYGASKRKHEDE